MDATGLSSSPSSAGVYKTVFLFLQNCNFSNTADTFRKECDALGKDIYDVSATSVILRHCRCSSPVCAGAEHNFNVKNGWLQGTIEMESKVSGGEEAHVVYVCDHEKNLNTANHQELNNIKEVQNSQETNTMITKSELLKLRGKFGNLQSDHRKLIAITTELAGALQTAMVSQTQNIATALEHCRTIEPSLFVPDTQSKHAAISNLQSPKENFVEPLNVDQSSVKSPLAPETVRQVLETVFDRTFAPESKSNETQNTPVGTSSLQNPKKNMVEPLNLEHSSVSPNLKTPLTPETVRQVLETVFDRSFAPENKSNETQNTSMGTSSIQNPKKNMVEPLNLEHSSVSPNLKTPLTPETVRQVLETVFDRIFAPENKNNETQNASVEKIYGNGDGRQDVGSLFEIDFRRLKEDLFTVDDDRKVKILQALRWRITKNESNNRLKVIDSYISNDVLDLCSGISVPEKLLYDSSACYVQEAMWRFLNTLASLRQGRDYLTSTEKPLNVIMKKVKNIRNITSDTVRDMSVATAQKLSMRKVCRVQMVREGLFGTLVDYLDESYDVLPRYCLEYCSALLMNLCLVQEAKDMSTKIPKKVVRMIKCFLEADISCCLPYINGIMFSLMENKVIVDEAKAQSLDKTITTLMKVNDNQNIRRQLDFILTSRMLGKADPSANSSGDEGQEELDLLEAELDQDDFKAQSPCGEELLKEYITNAPAEGSSNTIKPTIKRPSTLSSRTFCEDIKEFHHRPSAESGIFSDTKAAKFTCTDGLIRNFVRNKAVNRKGCVRWRANPLCYMENCQKLQQGTNTPCSCTQCVPGQSRYSCGCYDAICREVSVNTANESNFQESKTSTTTQCVQLEPRNRW